MKNFKTKILVNGHEYNTLKDIFPNTAKPLDILFIAKTPAPISVEVGHYFQGKQGQMFWVKLKEYNILKVRPKTFEDENLIENNFGLTDIIKIPRDFGNEPSNAEYMAGLDRILTIIKKYKPKVIIFVYKKVLDKILQLRFAVEQKSEYGFNPQFEKIFRCKVFVFPMPATPCTKKQAKIVMTKLKETLSK